MTSIERTYPDMLSMFSATVARHGADSAALYFDGVVSFDELDRRSDALAIHLQTNGLQRGDRVALWLQNDPAFDVALLGTWKAGGVAVVVNPMYRSREVEYLLADSGAKFVIGLDVLYDDVLRGVLDGGTTQVVHVVVASGRDFQTRDDERVLAAPADIPGVPRLVDITATAPSERPPAMALEPTDLAVLMYTSGTTGHPKGAMITHGSLSFASEVYREWIGLGPPDRILAVAPLFHITGLVGHVTIGFLTGAPTIFIHRFDGSVLLEAIREHRPTFTVGSITVFNNLASRPDITVDDFASFRAVFSGGAPIAPALRDSIRERTGMSIHNLYGMTETTGPAVGVPLGDDGRVDPRTGALSIGVPVFNTRVRVVDDNRQEVAAGEIGELLVAGPQVIPAYWNRPEQSVERIVDGEMSTGDVATRDEDGWLYLVDRKTDMIIASGYKVWPREVEDVLYTHPAIREAAVIGVPDDYRGETVKAVVSLHPGTECTQAEISEFCKAQMAAYKYPRIVEIVDDLPKTVTGKIMRRELRDR